MAALGVRNPPANAGDIRDTGLSPGLGRAPGGGHGNLLHILPWRIPWTEELGGLQSMELQRAGHAHSDLAHSPVELAAVEGLPHVTKSRKTC